MLAQSYIPSGQQDVCDPMQYKNTRSYYLYLIRHLRSSFNVIGLSIRDCPFGFL